ncbi:MAG TPA: J domain-containing protein [Thermomicrobiaceae bacterium]|nr:J domain-containing protein [Thermomicrobiaceae bacterium]
MEFRDYYKILGVSRDADEKTIKKAYRKLARQYHPDVNKGDARAEERFKEINEAYEVLKDADKRAKYDRFGADWERYQQAEQAGAGARSTDFGDWFSGGRGPGGGRYEYHTGGTTGTGGAGSFSDFFETLFGETLGRTQTRRRTQPQRGQDYEYPIEVTLRDAYHGTSRRFDVQIQERCPTCGGTGLNGNGACPTCNATGQVTRTKTLEVKIPAGVRTGSRVRVGGQGGPGVNGGPAGDIYLTVSLKPDPRVELDGDNLRTDIDVPLYTAMLGGEVIIPTLDSPVALTIPTGTQNGRVFRLRGKGMPALKGGTQGDLLARVRVALPANLSDEERSLFERLRELRSPHTVHA